MTTIQAELKELKKAGVDVSCRCPKPCMPHSDHYRGEALSRIRKPKDERFLLNAYGRQCFDLGFEAGRKSK